MLPYHVGVLEALQHHNYLHADTPIAGSSAGGIAVAAHACGIDGRRVLDATIEISDQCLEEGSTRGRLLPKLRNQLEFLVNQEEFELLQNRPGEVTISHFEIFPKFKSMHQTEFDDLGDLINAVCHSSSFPFFTMNSPVVIDTSKGGIPRVVVDGFFSVPRDRFGCPCFDAAGVNVDRTVMISVFPREKIGLEACDAKSCISPQATGGPQMENLLRLATQASSRKELTAIYEAGWEDAERWCRENDKSSQEDLSLEVGEGFLN